MSAMTAQVPGPATHPAGGPQLAERLGPLPGVVGGDAGRLAHDSDSGRPVAGVAGVLQRLLGVVVDQRASRDEMPGHLLGDVLLQTAQVAAGVGVQLRSCHVVRQRRLRDPDLVRSPTLAHLGLVAGPALPRAAAAAVGGAAAAVGPTLSRRTVARASRIPVAGALGPRTVATVVAAGRPAVDGSTRAVRPPSRCAGPESAAALVGVAVSTGPVAVGRAFSPRAL